MTNFYSELKKFKELNNLTYSHLGKVISVSGDTFRMAVSRETFSDIRIEKLTQYMNNFDSTSSMNKNSNRKNEIFEQLSIEEKLNQIHNTTREQT